MGRAAGRKMPREVKPGTPEGDYIGLSDRQTPGPEKGYDSPIPGGSTGGPHISNHPTVRQQVPVPAPKPEYRGVLAHGVQAGPYTTHERAEAERGPNEGHHALRPKLAEVKERIPPVPVYIVAQGGGVKPMKTAVARHFIVPGFNGDPVLICGRDVNRTKIRLMNNDASNNVRFAREPTSLAVDPGSANSRTIGGGLLVKGMTGYQDIETQDELWAITLHATATVELQVIMETSIAGAG